jgi:hypothetical protein
MSKYCTIGGSITYENQEAFDNAIHLLENGGWIKNGFMINELGNRICDTSDTSDVDIARKAFCIPVFLYRNLGAVLDSLFKGGKGEVVWTSTDSGFKGGVIVDGEETIYDLEKWAKENMEQEASLPPEDFAELCEWQQDVEREFFEEFS